MNQTARPVFRNPVTGEKSVLLTDSRTHPDRILVVHLSVSPGGRVAAAHFHAALEERFLILGGEVGFLIDGEESRLGAGEGARIPAGTVHDWWQVGDETAEVLVEVSPGDRFLEIVGSLFGLARDGKVGDEGLPGQLQLAVMGHEYRDVITFTEPPVAVQKIVVPPMAMLGRLLGRKPMYPQYLETSETETPVPAALAELTPEGRLRPFGAAG